MRDWFGTPSRSSSAPSTRTTSAPASKQTRACAINVSAPESLALRAHFAVDLETALDGGADDRAPLVVVERDHVVGDFDRMDPQPDRLVAERLHSVHALGGEHVLHELPAEKRPHSVQCIEIELAAEIVFLVEPRGADQRASPDPPPGPGDPASPPAARTAGPSPSSWSDPCAAAWSSNVRRAMGCARKALSSVARALVSGQSGRSVPEPVHARLQDHATVAVRCRVTPAAHPTLQGHVETEPLPRRCGQAMRRGRRSTRRRLFALGVLRAYAAARR